MKILYAIQATGNGHVSRAREIIPHLKQYGTLHLLTSGTQSSVSLDNPVDYKLSGLGFNFGKNGGIDISGTVRAMQLKNFIHDIKTLAVEDYDLIINDFEPVSAWACRLRKKACVALSHQSAFYSPKTPHLPGFHYGRVIMNHYAPAAAHIGFHFERYDEFIHTPVIRSEIRETVASVGEHYTVYLPAFSEQFILDVTAAFPETRWQIFSRHCKVGYKSGNAEVFPVNNANFHSSLATCRGLLTGGGFEGPSEALFLNKKLLCVPMKNQYEQQCNALALQTMGVPVIWKKHDFRGKVKQFLESDEAVTVNFPDETAAIVRALVENYAER